MTIARRLKSSSEHVSWDFEMLHRERPRIPIYKPDLSGNEKRYVNECLDETWISSRGKFVERFEIAIAELVGAGHAVSVHNGTEAAHLALSCAGVKPGDEVIVPTFTYIASVNTITQCGAVPIFAECDPETWQLDPADVVGRMTPRVKAIVPVHLYGGACDMSALCSIAQGAGLKVIEDCCEALGTKLDGRHVGTLGLAGTFSFYGNKTITTGEGGMVVTSDQSLADQMRVVRNQGMSLTRRYWHDRMGYNYRMTNIQAAIGLAQTERVSETLMKKRAVADGYRQRLKDLPVDLQRVAPGVEASEWLVSLLLPDATQRDAVMAFLDSRDIETRPVFECAHLMPMYGLASCRYPVSEDISRRGISLPSYPGLTADDLDYIVESLADAIR
jgi:perosamine synthetase